MCSTLFCTFLCRHCTTATWNSLKWLFMEDVNTRLQISLSPSRNLGGGPQEFNSRQIHLHSTDILHQSEKSRPTLGMKSFKQWRFRCRRRRRWQSSLLRVRENGVVKNLHSRDSICKKMRFRWQFSLDGGRWTVGQTTEKKNLHFHVPQREFRFLLYTCSQQPLYSS